jgi:hypothetical protein
MRSAASLLAVLLALSGPIWIAAPPAGAQAYPWTLGIVESSFIWSPPSGVIATIPDCAYHLAKQSGYQARSARPGEESPLQHCLVQVMREHGASANALAFTHWYHDMPGGDSVFMTSLTKPQFGIVQIAGIEYPGRANNTTGYLFVNGTNPRLTNPDVIFAPKGQPWMHDAGYEAIEAAHQHAMVYPALSYVSVAKREAGGQVFTFAAPILDGCHSCAQIGVIYIAYEFGALGSPKGARVTAIHPCPSSDRRCTAP